MRELNFDESNLAERWKYCKRNLKFLGVWEGIEYKVRETVRGTIQTIVLEEFSKEIGRKKYGRGEGSYRGGNYGRSLVTRYGKIEIQVPKSPKGKRIIYSVFKPHQRRQEKYDKFVVLSIMLGLSGRKQKTLLKSFTGVSISATTASKLIKNISEEVRNYRQRELRDRYKYIYIDGIWISMKEIGIKKRPLLIAIGITLDGKKEVIGYKLCKGETEVECTGFIDDLYRRGLKGKHLKLVITDGSKGIINGVNQVYPYARIQLCTVHKLRNILRDIKEKKKHRKGLIKEASAIFKSEDKPKAIKRYKRFINKWKDKEDKAVKTLKRDIEYYFEYYNFPRDERKSIRTNNVIERINREVRRVTRRIGYFQSSESLDIYTYLVFKERSLLMEENIKKEDVPFILPIKKECA